MEKWQIQGIHAEYENIIEGYDFTGVKCIPQCEAKRTLHLRQLRHTTCMAGIVITGIAEDAAD